MTVCARPCGLGAVMTRIIFSPAIRCLAHSDPPTPQHLTPFSYFLTPPHLPSRHNCEVGNIVDKAVTAFKPTSRETRGKPAGNPQTLLNEDISHVYRIISQPIEFLFNFEQTSLFIKYYLE